MKLLRVVKDHWHLTITRPCWIHNRMSLRDPRLRNWNSYDCYYCKEFAKIRPLARREIPVLRYFLEIAGLLPLNLILSLFRIVKFLLCPWALVTLITISPKSHASDRCSILLHINFTWCKILNRKNPSKTISGLIFERCLRNFSSYLLLQSPFQCS